MSLYPVAGCKIYIGGALADKSVDFAAADFTSQTWVLINGWQQMGAFGDTSQIITSSLIGEGRDKKLKGTRNGGQMSNVFSIIPTDPGQIALIAAEKSQSNFAFKVELNDKPTGTDPTASQRLFIALVNTAQETGGEANTVRNLNATLEINSNIVPVAADTGD